MDKPFLLVICIDNLWVCCTEQPVGVLKWKRVGVLQWKRVGVVKVWVCYSENLWVCSTEQHVGVFQ